MKNLSALMIWVFLSLRGAAGHADGATIRVARPDGSKQCGGAPLGLDVVKRELTSEGIPVSAAACGNDGMAHAAVCGADTGGLYLFEIPAASLAAAQSLGFRSLAEWPDASATSCADGTQPAASTQGAVEVSILGVGPPVDAVAYRRVRKAIGTAFSKGTVDGIVVYGYGIEGGFSACLTQGRFTDTKTFDAFVERLRAIRAHRVTTAYSVTSVEHCAAPGSTP